MKQCYFAVQAQAPEPMRPGGRASQAQWWGEGAMPLLTWPGLSSGLLVDCLHPVVGGRPGGDLESPQSMMVVR